MATIAEGTLERRTREVAEDVWHELRYRMQRYLPHGPSRWREFQLHVIPGTLKKHHPELLGHIVSTIMDPRSSIEDIASLFTDLPRLTLATNRVVGVSAAKPFWALRSHTFVIEESFVTAHAKLSQDTVLEQLARSTTACVSVRHWRQAWKIAAAASRCQAELGTRLSEEIKAGIQLHLREMAMLVPLAILQMHAGAILGLADPIPPALIIELFAELFPNPAISHVAAVAAGANPGMDAEGANPGAQTVHDDAIAIAANPIEAQ